VPLLKEKRRYRRFTKRLEVKFSSGGNSFTGISSDLSETGIFIRTQKGLAPGTHIYIDLVLPDGRISFLKGIVRRTLKTPISALKNGMGVEIIEKDEIFSDFIKSFVQKTEAPSEDKAVPEFQIISCPSCGTKNKVLTSKIPQGPKCGKCKASLIV
jgi:hypothetical protein